MDPVPAVYNDDFADEVRDQLLQVDAAQVWVNPIEEGRGREKLDAMLREVASSGVLVSAHPDTIQKMGTKDVLYRTRYMGWGSDVRVYRTWDELRNALSTRLNDGQARVLKQFRGHSGNGIWKVAAHPSDPALVVARHAARGSEEQSIAYSELFDIFKPYFEGEGRMIEQAYQERIREGMVRCYLIRDRIEGFGHQAINALHPEEPQPGPRLYHPPSTPDFQNLKRKMEIEWVPEMLECLGMGEDDLPLLWDADFMYGPRNSSGEDSYVLCEINVSSVYPYPESAIVPLAAAFRMRIGFGWPSLINRGLGQGGD